MKTIITKSETSKTGYAINFDGQSIDINETDPKNPSILKLPENPSNRKWYSIAKIEKGLTELTYKETRTIDRTNTPDRPTATKNWTEYLTDEERTIIDEIKQKCATRAKRDKILKQIEALKAILGE